MPSRTVYIRDEIYNFLIRRQVDPGEFARDALVKQFAVEYGDDKEAKKILERMGVQ